MTRITEKLSRLIGSRDAPFMRSRDDEHSIVLFPTINVREDDLYYDFEIAVPGFALDDIKVTIRNNKLIVKGKKEEDIEDKESGYIRTEHRVDSFERIFDLDFLADSENISATMKDGIMKFRIIRR